MQKVQSLGIKDFIWSWKLDAKNKKYIDEMSEGIEIISVKLIESCDMDGKNPSMEFNGNLPRVLRDETITANLKFASSWNSYIKFEINRMVVVKGNMIA